MDQKLKNWARKHRFPEIMLLFILLFSSTQYFVQRITGSKVLEVGFFFPSSLHQTKMNGLLKPLKIRNFTSYYQYVGEGSLGAHKTTLN